MTQQQTPQPLPDPSDYPTAAQAADSILRELIRLGAPIPTGVVTPPIAGVCPPPQPEDFNPRWDCPQYGTSHSHCVHCGEIIPREQHLREHGIDPVPDAMHSDGKPLRILVAHCNDCIDSDHCTPGVVTDRGNGFCTPIGGRDGGQS